MQQCQQEIKDVAFIIGYNKAEGDKLYNAAGLFYQGRCLTEYYKRHLPNYGVFDEKRYFIPGEEQGVIEFKGIKFKPFASGKGDTKFKVGGNFLFLIESIEYIDSTLPEAPNK